MQGWIQEFALGEVRPLSPPLPLRSRVPLKPAKGICGSAVSCPSAVHGRAPTENKFSAFSSCEKATGGNHFEYSEVHVVITAERSEFSTGAPSRRRSVARSATGGGSDPL